MRHFFIPPGESRSHLSENALIRMMDLESSPAREWCVNRHLNRCTECRARYEQLQRAARESVEFHQSVVRQVGPLSSARRDLFIRRLDSLLESVPAESWWEPLLGQFAVQPFGGAAPSFKSAVIVICVGLTLSLVWRWQLPSASAAEFLNRAVVSNQSSAKIAGSGVIRQRLRITTARKTIEHDVYLDASSHRQPRYAKVAAEEADLAARLALAGVNWDDPLSAASFKYWHDHQVNPKDEIHSSLKGLLTISTRLPSTNIAQESFTVREDGFHPVERTIEYRELGTIDISEVGLEVLSPDAANQLFVDPAPNNNVTARRLPGPAVPPSTAHINEVELQTRLMLNRNGADTGEQIEITRDLNGVLVQGVVESEERKKELNESLHGIPLLSVVIKSFDDLKSVASPGEQVAVTQQRSAVAQVSSLEQYFMQHGRSRADLSRISAGLFNSSLAINRSSRSLQQIALRFPDERELSAAAIQARDELLSRTVARLLADLKDQQQLLDEADIASDSEAIIPGNPDTGHVDFVRVAERNTAATRELVSGSGEANRPEKLVVADLAQTISQLRAAALAFISNCGTKR